MKLSPTITTAFTIILLTLLQINLQACSMYKITVDGKTMVGCNEDNWRTTSKICFVNARNAQEYGIGFTGSRQVSGGRTAPQSGMNEVGLTFSRLVAYHPLEESPFTDRLKINDEVVYLTDILHKCATVDEVKSYIERYDHSIFIDDVYIYIDSTGDYLVVEPYKLIKGNDPNYVLSNFCPSITDNDQARNLERYRNGEDFLRSQDVNGSLAFCRAVSDTMHVCRSRNGDGTLLTSIWDTKEGLVNLYFYHSFDTTVQFNLKDELAKGDRIMNIPEMFPTNPEFERLANYKTPFNTPPLRVGLAFLGGILALISFLLVVSLLLHRNSDMKFISVVLIGMMNMVLAYYMFVLATNINIFYFDAPYTDYGSRLISASSYIPFMLLLVLFPLVSFVRRQYNSESTKGWVKALLLFNVLICFLLVFGFGYWGLYSVWN